MFQIKKSFFRFQIFRFATKKPNITFTPISTPNANSTRKQWPPSNAQQIRISIQKKLEAVPIGKSSDVLREFRDSAAQFKTVYEAKLLFMLLIKHKVIMDKEFIKKMMEHFEFSEFQKSNMENKSFIIYALTQVTNRKSEEFNYIRDIYIKLSNILEAELTLQSLSTIKITRINSLFFAMLHFEKPSDKFLEIYSSFFKKNVGSFKEKEIISSLVSYGKLFAYYESNSFKSEDYTSQLESIKNTLKQTTELPNKIKALFLDQNSNLFALGNVATSLSRLEFQKEDIWQVIINTFALRIDEMEDKAFEKALSSITSKFIHLNPLILNDFKKYFDSKLRKEGKSVATEYFVRCFKAFISPGNSIITSDDPGLPLYNAFIIERAAEFTLKQNISTIYCMVQMDKYDPKVLQQVASRTLNQITESDFVNNEGISILFWALAVLEYQDPLFWEKYENYFQSVNFSNMNNKSLTNNIIPALLLSQKKKDDALFLQRYQELKKLTYIKSFLKVDNYVCCSGLDIFHILKASGIEFKYELPVMVYPVDYYLPEFRQTDFDSKLKQIEQIAKEFQQIFPGEGVRVNKPSGFQSLEEIEEFTTKTRENGLVIEIQGETHYIFKEERWERRPSKQKRKIIGGAGWEILTITSSECKEIGEMPTIDMKIERFLTLLKGKQEEMKNKA